MLPVKNSHRNQSSASTFSGQRNKRPRLGQILVGAGLVETDTLHGCLGVARRTHQKLGAVLVDKNVVSRETLDAALLAQRLIADGTVAENSSDKILKTATQQRIDLFTAMKKLEDTWQADQNRHQIPELPQLLLASGMVNAPTMAEVQSIASTSGMSLGKALLVTNALSTENLDAILIMIVLIRNGSLNIKDAIKAVKDLRYNRIEVTRQALHFPTRTRSQAPLGDLLVVSNCVNDFECLFAIESALASNRQLGQMLINTGLVSRSMVEQALRLQKFTACGVLSDELASTALRRMEQDGLSLMEVASQLKLFKDSTDATAAIELLMAAGYVNAAMVQQAILKQAALEMDPAKALLASGMIKPSVMKCARTCVQLIEAGNLSLQQAFELIEDADRNLALTTSAVTKVIDQAKLDAELKRQATCGQNPVKQLQNRVSSWLDCPELRLLVIVLIAISVAVLAALCFVPAQFHAGCLLGALALFGAAAIYLGCCWTKRTNDAIVEESVRMESGRQTMQKLQQRKH